MMRADLEPGLERWSLSFGLRGVIVLGGDGNPWATPETEDRTKLEELFVRLPWWRWGSEGNV